MDDKDTINTYRELDSPNADNPYVSAQDAGSTDSNPPYSLRKS